MNTVDTGNPTPRFFLFIGSTTADAAVSKLKASGVFYRQKMLESKPANWQSIVELVEDRALIGVLAKLTAQNYRLLARDHDYGDVSVALLSALGKVRHVVFVHEAVLAGGDTSPESPALSVFDDEEESFYEYLANHYFSPPPDEVRDLVNQLLHSHGVHVVPYKTNAELSVLSAAFIEDNEKNLLFRLYVPNGRIYAAEADKLLALFREWLTGVKRQHVRQDGYRTGSGQVYEFFGDDATTPSGLTTEFNDFSRFLELCVDRPDEARDQLAAEGVDDLVAEDIVRRYGRETRRLHLDLRHAREARLLSIRQRLESELVDVLGGDSSQWTDINRVLEAAVPATSNIFAALEPISAAAVATPQTHVTINQQIIESVDGAVIQGLQGTFNLGPQAHELLKLVQRFGGAEAAALESALHELEDEDARNADRLGAKQRLKAFLFKLGGKVEESALVLLQRYIEGKLAV